MRWRFAIEIGEDRMKIRGEVERRPHRGRKRKRKQQTTKSRRSGRREGRKERFLGNMCGKQRGARKREKKSGGEIEKSDKVEDTSRASREKMVEGKTEEEEEEVKEEEASAGRSCQERVVMPMPAVQES